MCRWLGRLYGSLYPYSGQSIRAGCTAGKSNRTGAAARIKGSIVWDLLSDQAKQADILKIGHPSGVIPIEAKCVGDKITKLGVCRTARMIMDGYVYVRKSVYKE